LLKNYPRTRAFETQMEGANETAENIDREGGSSGRTGVQSVVDAFKKNRTHCDGPDSVDGKRQKGL